VSWEKDEQQVSKRVSIDCPEQLNENSERYCGMGGFAIHLLQKASHVGKAILNVQRLLGD